MRERRCNDKHRFFTPFRLNTQRCDGHHSTGTRYANSVRAIMKNITVRNGRWARERLLAKGRRALRRSAILIQMLDLVLEAGDRPDSGQTTVSGVEIKSN